MPTNSRQKRQQTFFFRITANFVLFCLVAVPLQFHIQWYENLFGHNKDWLTTILRSGPMYFYALILCIESNLRLEHYPYLLFGDRRIYLLRLILLIPIIIFGGQYFISPLYRDVCVPLPTYEQVLQIGVGIFAFLLSTITHLLVTSQETKKIR